MNKDMRSIQRQMRGPDASEARAAMDAAQKEEHSSWRRIKSYFGYGVRRIDATVQEQFNSAWIAMALIITLVGLALHIPALLDIAAILFTTVAASWLWNRLAFFGLRYERAFSERRVFMGEEVEVSVSLANHKWLPLPWVTTSDVFPKELPVAETTLVVRGDTGKGELSNFWAVKWRDKAIRRYHIKAAVRGFHTFGPVDIQTGDGFGMFRSVRRQAGEQTLVVYPRVLPLASLGLPAKEPFGDRNARQFMFDDPLRTVGVRDYRNEDDFRKVHWKASARRQRLQTRVLQPTTDTKLMVCLNVQTVAKSYMGVIPEHLEKMVSVAASISYYALMQRWPTGLLANGALPHSDQSLKILPGRSPAQLTTILELLAAVTPFTTDPFHRLLAAESPHLPWGATLVVISSSLPQELAATMLDLKATGRRIVFITLEQRPLAQLLPGVIIHRLPEGAWDELDLGRPTHGAEALLTPDQRQEAAIREAMA